MRSRSLGIGVVGSLLLVAALGGCPSFPGDLCDNGACDPGSDGGASSSGGDGGDGGIIKPPDCDLTKEPKDSPSCVDDGVGVFVSPTGSDSAAGTKAAPVRSIGKALAVAGAKRVYVCDGTYEGFELKAGTTVAGGFACADWKHTGVKPKVQGNDGSKPAVDLLSANAPLLLDLEILGPTKGAPNSVALRAVDTTATLRRVKLVAGDGADGADGTRTDFNYPLQEDLNGKDAAGGTGGGEKSFTCPGGAVTKGGKGGDSGFSGDPGMPALGGGAGGDVLQACAGPGSGGDGTSGPSPTAADGAKALGTLTASAWVPQAGTAGPNGSPGQAEAAARASAAAAAAARAAAGVREEAEVKAAGRASRSSRSPQTSPSRPASSSPPEQATAAKAWEGSKASRFSDSVETGSLRPAWAATAARAGTGPRAGAEPAASRRRCSSKGPSPP